MAVAAGATVTLADGRSLGYREEGPREGTPVLLFHGAPGSRLLSPDQEATERRGARLIVPDRPGYGLSDAMPGRTAVDWVGDVVSLADSLDLERFAVVGWSAGAIHALACAARIPDRLTAVGIISGSCPPEEDESVLQVVDGMQLVYDGARDDRAATEQLVGAFFQGYADDLSSFYDQAKSTNPDDPFWAEPGWDTNFREHIEEGLRPGIAGYASDQVIGCLPGFRLSEVVVPVLAWYAENDLPLSLASAGPLREALADCTMERWDGVGHAGLYARWDDVLSALTGGADR